MPDCPLSSATPKVRKVVVENDVEYQIRSGGLRERLENRCLAPGSIELSLRCPNLTAVGWGDEISVATRPLSHLESLLRIDLSGCPKLESIPEMAFGYCEHLVSVIFNEQLKCI